MIRLRRIPGPGRGVTPPIREHRLGTFGPPPGTPMQSLPGVVPKEDKMAYPLPRPRRLPFRPNSPYPPGGGQSIQPLPTTYPVPGMQPTPYPRGGGQPIQPTPTQTGLPGGPGFEQPRSPGNPGGYQAPTPYPRGGGQPIHHTRPGQGAIAQPGGPNPGGSYTGPTTYQGPGGVHWTWGNGQWTRNHPLPDAGAGHGGPGQGAPGWGGQQPFGPQQPQHPGQVGLPGGPGFETGFHPPGQSQPASPNPGFPPPGLSADQDWQWRLAHGVDGEGKPLSPNAQWEYSQPENYRALITGAAGANVTLDPGMIAFLQEYYRRYGMPVAGNAQALMQQAGIGPQPQQMEYPDYFDAQGNPVYTGQPMYNYTDPSGRGVGEPIYNRPPGGFTGSPSPNTIGNPAYAPVRGGGQSGGTPYDNFTTQGGPSLPYQQLGPPQPAQQYGQPQQQGGGQAPNYLPLDPQFEAGRRALEQQLAQYLSSINISREQIPAMVNVLMQRLHTNQGLDEEKTNEDAAGRGIFNSGIRTQNLFDVGTQYDRQRQDAAFNAEQQYTDLASQEAQAQNQYNTGLQELLLASAGGSAGDTGLGAYGPQSPAYAPTYDVGGGGGTTTRRRRKPRKPMPPRHRKRRPGS